MATKARESFPTVREVRGRSGTAYIVEVTPLVCTLRPKGTRSPRVRVEVEWGEFYQRALVAQLDAERRTRAKARGRRRR